MQEPDASEWVRRLVTRNPSHRQDFNSSVRDLQRTIGDERVEDFFALAVSMIAKFQPQELAQGVDLFYDAATTDTWMYATSRSLRNELEAIRGRIAHRDEWYHQAQNGHLAVSSRTQQDPTAFDHAPHDHPDGLDRQREKAANWIAYGVREKARTYYRTLEEEDLHISEAPFGSAAYVRRLHGIVFGPDEGRLNLVGESSKYPSSVGGTYLLDELYRRARIPPRLADTEPVAYWTNWALYLAGMVGAAQPFKDGNKRTIRTLYSLIVLGGTGQFLAPPDATAVRMLDMA